MNGAVPSGPLPLKGQNNRKHAITGVFLCFQPTPYKNYVIKNVEFYVYFCTKFE